jgi:hypothetical protein
VESVSSFARAPATPARAASNCARVVALLLGGGTTPLEFFGSLEIDLRKALLHPGLLEGRLGLAHLRLQQIALDLEQDLAFLNTVAVLDVDDL